MTCFAGSKQAQEQSAMATTTRREHGRAGRGMEANEHNFPRLIAHYYAALFHRGPERKETVRLAWGPLCRVWIWALHGDAYGTPAQHKC